MGLVKFNCTSTVAQATSSTRDNDTIYFTNDEQSIFFRGKRVGGNSVYAADKAYYIEYAEQLQNLNTSSLFKYWADTETANLPPSKLIENAAEYGDIDITVQGFQVSNSTASRKQVCEILWPNGTNSSNADIQPTYEKWERIRVDYTWYDWRKVQDSNEYPLHIYYLHDYNQGGYDNIMNLAEGDKWIDNIQSSDKRKIWDYVSNGGRDVTIHFKSSQFAGEYCIKPDTICIYNVYDTEEKHIVLKFNSSIGDYLDITGFA